MIYPLWPSLDDLICPGAWRSKLQFHMFLQSFKGRQTQIRRIFGWCFSCDSNFLSNWCACITARRSAVWSSCSQSILTSNSHFHVSTSIYLYNRCLLSALTNTPRHHGNMYFITSLTLHLHCPALVLSLQHGCVVAQCQSANVHFLFDALPVHSPARH